MAASEEDNSSDEGDPLPATEPPQWAADLMTEARRRAGREVYPPSDDTFLLVELLAKEAERFRVRRPRLCLEIGSGSGAALAGLAMVLHGDGSSVAYSGGGMSAASGVTAESCTDDCDGVGQGSGGGLHQHQPLLVATDKNPFAAACTESILRTYCPSAVALVVQTAFVQGLRLAGRVDVGLCNPPYVPTPPEEMVGCGIEVSWAGGDRGREMIDLLLPEIATLLSRDGVFYMICMAENEPDEIIARALTVGLAGEVACRERRGIEELYVIRLYRAAA
eukprot:TRINITY_DN33789_c0_g1_i1.p1 TRINITY_DN33789_c0_g1~~TRINITY_DN33789_c0_g1_i1.p1  ORF type:complete len:278 (+),score=59.27 TRINITY_DN33789_c0_g1_i1:73-906(+)